MVTIKSSGMRDSEKDLSADQFISSFGNLSLTDELADVMKLSILLKCHQIHKDVHNVTIGPNSTISAVQAPERKKSLIETKPRTTVLSKKTADNKGIAEYSESTQPRSTRNETHIIHFKTRAEVDLRRRDDVNENIEKRRQLFEDFDKKLCREKKISWLKRHEAMIRTMHQQKLSIIKVLEEHDNEVYARNKKIEDRHKQLAEKKIKEERDINESIKYIKGLIDGISKSQSEFLLIYNDVAGNIKNMTPAQRYSVAAHVTTLDQLYQQLETVVAKCKKLPHTLQQKDLSKCNEITSLASRIRKQVSDVIIKIEKCDVKEKVAPVPAQTAQMQVPNTSEYLPVLSPPRELPQPSTISPAFAPVIIHKFTSTPQSTIQHTTSSLPVFQTTLQAETLVERVPETVPEPLPTDRKALLKLEKYVNKSSLEKYVYLQNLLKHTEQIYKQILEDSSLKIFKNNCKKAVNTPVNTLTDATPQHLLDKYDKLNDVLSGRTVEISGDRINAGQHPHGIDFCMDLLAKKFVLQGDLIVSSNTAVSAFNYASVMISLWNDFPMFGELLLGHFYRECPYLVPFYPPNIPGQSEEEFCKSQGYRYSNDEVEDQDIFLKRMVGFMRLYAATLVAAPKQSQKGISHQSMAVAWHWLASTMNLQPRADVTAAMIHTFLETVGYKMQLVFGKQFDKLISFLSNEYMAKIRNIDTEGPVKRLELLLQDYVKDGSFSGPNGTLPNNFW